MLGRWFGDAIAHLKWSPADFWEASIAEFFLAINGHNRANRIGPEPLTMAEFEELEARYLVKG